MMNIFWKELLIHKRIAKNNLNVFVKHVGINDITRVINEEISVDKASMLGLLRDGRLISIEAVKNDVWGCNIRIHQFEDEHNFVSKTFDGSLDKLWKGFVKAWRSRDMSITEKNCKLQCGFVYFIQVQNGDSYVKIGYSKNIVQRWNHGLITDSPYIYQILGSCVALPAHEKLLHNIFMSVRIRKEWFAPCDELLEVANFLDGRSLATYRSLKSNFDTWQKLRRN